MECLDRSFLQQCLASALLPVDLLRLCGASRAIASHLDCLDVWQKKASDAILDLSSVDSKFLLAAWSPPMEKGIILGTSSLEKWRWTAVIFWDLRLAQDGAVIADCVTRHFWENAALAKVCCDLHLVAGNESLRRALSFEVNNYWSSGLTTTRTEPALLVFTFSLAAIAEIEFCPGTRSIRISRAALQTKTFGWQRCRICLWRVPSSSSCTTCKRLADTPREDLALGIHDLLGQELGSPVFDTGGIKNPMTPQLILQDADQDANAEMRAASLAGAECVRPNGLVVANLVTVELHGPTMFVGSAFEFLVQRFRIAGIYLEED